MEEVSIGQIQKIADQCQRIETIMAIRKFIVRALDESYKASADELETAASLVSILASYNLL